MTNQRIMGHGPGGSEDRFQGPRIRKDGSLFEADVVLTALRDAHGTVLLKGHARRHGPGADTPTGSGEDRGRKLQQGQRRFPCDAQSRTPNASHARVERR